MKRMMVVALLFVSVTAAAVSQTAPGTRIDNLSKVHFRYLNGKPDSAASQIASMVVVARPRFNLTKSVMPSSAVYGDSVAFTLIISDTSGTGFTNVVVVDSIPAEFTVLSGWKGTLTGNILRYPIPSLSAGQSDTVTLDCRLDAVLGSGTVITNRAAATDSAGTTATASAGVTVSGSPQLSIEKAVSRDTVFEGDTLRYILRLRNTGDVALTNISAVDTIPLTLTSVSTSGNASFVAGVVLYHGNTLPVGASDSILIAATVRTGLTSGQTILNTAWARTRQTVSRFAAASAIVRQRSMAVNLRKSGPANTVAGDTVSYTISANDFPAGLLTNITVTDSLHPLMRFISATGGGSYDSVRHAVTWLFAQWDTTRPFALSVTVRMSDTLSAGRVAVNVATWKADQTSDAQAQAQTFVRPRSRVSIWKVASRASASPGDTLSYAIFLGNTGTVVAGSLTITDVLPAEVTYLDATPQASFDTQTRAVVWNLDSLAAGAQVQLILRARVTETAGAGEYHFTNIAQVQWDDGETSSLADGRSKPDVSVLLPFLHAQKQALRHIAEIGDIVPYTVRVSNTSSASTAFDIRIVDLLPLGFAYVAGSSLRDSNRIADPSGVTELRWKLADSLPAGRSALLTYRLVAGPGAMDGNGINSASARARTPGGSSISSNVTTDRVDVRRGVFSDRGIVVGKVFYDDNENLHQDEGEEGIRGVEMMMEDGTRVTSGDDGKYSLPDVNPGEHVLRLREETLPPNDELLLGYGEFALTPSSRFLHVTESGIGRADFYVHRGTVLQSLMTQQVGKFGSLAIRRIATPKNVVFVRDEGLLPIRIKGTQFEAGKAILKPEAYSTLKAVADLAREFPNQTIAISGHTDSIPIHSAEFPSNQELSEARATAVKEYLVRQQRIDSARMTILGFAATQPVASNKTQSGRALNRRVEISMASHADAFEQYFKTVQFSVGIDYEGAAAVGRLEIRDLLDSAFHFQQNSAMVNGHPIATQEEDNRLTWTIDSVGRSYHAVLTYRTSVYSPATGSQAASSITHATYDVGDSRHLLNTRAVTMTTIARLVKPKPMRFVLSGVLFETGKAALRQEGMNSLRSAAEVLRMYPQATATIEGHTDSKPIKTKEFPTNVALSHARASAALQSLREDFGIDAARLTAYGWGELKPVAPNATNQGRASNRRVEIRVDKNEGALEQAVQEGSADSSRIIVQKVEGDHTQVAFDTAASCRAGDKFMVRLTVRRNRDRRVTGSMLIDSLPAQLKFVAGSLAPVSGMDSVWEENGTIVARCASGDSIHSLSYIVQIDPAIEVQDGSAMIEHRFEIHHALVGGTEAIERSHPLIIRVQK